MARLQPTEGELKMKDQIRQGDVMLRRVSSLPKGSKQVEPTNGKFILALGEATGHHHRIEQTEDVHCFVANDNDKSRRFYVVDNPAMLLHEEHEAIELDDGIWEQLYQHEASDEEDPVPVLD
jgi:hypothetical protein